jgi:hypothetical protein
MQQKRQGTLDKFILPPTKSNANNQIIEIESEKKTLNLDAPEGFFKAKNELFEKAKKLLEKNGNLEDNTTKDKDNGTTTGTTAITNIKDIKPKRVNKVRYLISFPNNS